MSSLYYNKWKRNNAKEMSVTLEYVFYSGMSIYLIVKNILDSDVRYIEINKSICVKLILDKTFFNEKAAVLERRDFGETL
jgi:hypothetical protein